MQITINIPDTFPISIRGHARELSAAKLAPLALETWGYGIIQKLQDATSGAYAEAVAMKFGDDAKSADAKCKAWRATPEGQETISECAAILLDKAIASIESGVWSKRGTGTSGIDDETKIARRLALAAIRASKGDAFKSWADTTSAPDQLAAVEKVLADNADHFAVLVAAEIAERAATAKRKASLSTLVISI